MAELNNFCDFTPQLDTSELNTNSDLNFEYNELSSETIRAVLKSKKNCSQPRKTDRPETRKKSKEEEDGRKNTEGPDLKRQETDGNGTRSKKPGRQLANSEPATVS